MSLDTSFGQGCEVDTRSVSALLAVVWCSEVRVARLPLGMGVSWRAHPPAEFSPSPKGIALVIFSGEKAVCTCGVSEAQHNTQHKSSIPHFHFPASLIFFPAGPHSPPLRAEK